MSYQVSAASPLCKGGILAWPVEDDVCGTVAHGISKVHISSVLNEKTHHLSPSVVNFGGMTHDMIWNS